MSSITSANSVIYLAIAGLFPTPQQLQGFSADAIFDTEKLNNAEVSMGLDGHLSAGFIFKEVKWNVTLQSDSDSNFMFDQWYNAQQGGRELLPCSGVVLLETLNSKWTLNRGFLTGYQPIPAAKKILEPRNYELTFESIVPTVA